MHPIATSSLRFALVLLIGLSTQGLLLMQGLFVLRQDVIVETLCVNRDRPELHCDGKCFLTQKMLEHREAEKDERLAFLTVQIGVSAVEVASAALAAPSAAVQAEWAPSAPEWASEGVGDVVFRPPKG